MAGDIVYSVFVSSTYIDLREERAEVQKSLLKLQCMPAGMELFGSDDEETWDVIKRQIDSCDYYVLVIADWYGSVAADGISYTEMEYNYAKQTGKPVLAFVRRDRRKVANEFSEVEPVRRAKLNAFIERVQKSPVSFYDNAHELAKEVTVSFVNYRDRRPAVGYIRADKSIDPQKYSAVLEKNILLNSKLAALAERRDAPFLGSDKILKIKLNGSVQIKVREGLVLTDDYILNVIEGCLYEITWGSLFVLVAEIILVRTQSENSIRFNILEMFLQRIDISMVPEEYKDKKISLSFADGSEFNQMKTKLYGLGLIEYFTATELIFNRPTSYMSWRLTDYAQLQYGLLMAQL